MMMMMRYCEIAVKISAKSGHPVHKHGALLVKGRQIIATGYNDENHHAEANAILRCLQ